MRCKTILIAEDNRDIREAISDALVSEGYAVYTAANGKDALETLEKIDHPTLIFLDLMMPVMNGWEFLDAQKANAVIAPHHAIVVSAIPATRSLEDQTPLETSGSIRKPIDLDILLAKAAEFCDRAEV